MKNKERRRRYENNYSGGGGDKMKQRFWAIIDKGTDKIFIDSGGHYDIYNSKIIARKVKMEEFSMPFCYKIVELEIKRIGESG